MIGPKPVFRGDPTDPVDLEFYEREVREWEARVVEADELRKAAEEQPIEEALEEDGTLTNLSNVPEDVLEQFLATLRAAPVAGPPGAAGVDGASVDLDDVLITNDAHIIADENGNLVRSGGTRV